MLPPILDNAITIIVYLLIYGFLGIIFITGLVIFGVSFFRRKRKKKKGMPVSWVGIKAGIIVMSIPFLICITFSIWFSNSAIVKPMYYEEKLTEYIKNKDVDSILELFSEYERKNNPNLKKDLEEMFASIPEEIGVVDVGSTDDSRAYHCIVNDKIKKRYVFRDNIVSIRTGVDEEEYHSYAYDNRCNDEYILYYEGFSKYDKLHNGITYMRLVHIDSIYESDYRDNMLNYLDAGSEEDIFETYENERMYVYESQKDGKIRVSDKIVSDEVYREEQVITNALNKNDVDALKQLFSNNVAEEYDLDKQIKEALEFIDGEIVSIDRLPSVDEYSNSDTSVKIELAKDGSKKYCERLGSVMTDKGTYYTIRFYGVYCDKNSKDNIGIESIRIFNDSLPEYDFTDNPPEKEIIVGREI